MNEKENSERNTPKLSEKSLREALICLSTSPVKKEQEAINRLERVAGRSISEIVEELDNAQILLDSMASSSEDPAVRNKTVRARAVLTGIFTGTITGLIALILQPGQIYLALGLGIGMGTSGSMLWSSRDRSEKRPNSDFKL